MGKIIFYFSSPRSLIVNHLVPSFLGSSFPGEGREREPFLYLSYMHYIVTQASTSKRHYTHSGTSSIQCVYQIWWCIYSFWQILLLFTHYMKRIWHNEYLHYRFGIHIGWRKYLNEYRYMPVGSANLWCSLQFCIIDILNTVLMWMMKHVI